MRAFEFFFRRPLARIGRYIGALNCCIPRTAPPRRTSVLPPCCTPAVIGLRPPGLHAAIAEITVLPGTPPKQLRYTSWFPTSELFDGQLMLRLALRAAQTGDND